MPLYNLNFISREEWGAVPPSESIPKFEHPGYHVILTLKSESEACTTKEDCSEKVRQMQKLHMEELGLPDIAYNFIFGNDGNIYVGRGWDQKGDKAIGNPKFDGRTFDFGVIGDYRREIPDEVYYMTTSLLTYAVQNEFLLPDYTYQGHVDGEEDDEPRENFIQAFDESPSDFELECF